MLPTDIRLVDRSSDLIDAWEQTFAEFDGVSVRQGDFFAEPADAMVSPANSFGIMDGGLDLAIRDRLGLNIQSRVQRAILEQHHGELPVGSALVVDTDVVDWPFLVVAPTMRVSEPISQTLNAYHAFRACLLSVRAFNDIGDSPRIQSMVVPGLGTGVGRMEPTKCAVQMRLAYQQVSRPAQIPSFDRIHLVHRKLKSPT